MGKRKAKGRCVKWHADFVSAREDMISKLSDALITEILLYLPTKQAVRASVLSHRWKSLWLLIPGLDLAYTQFPNYNAFVSFVDRFIDFSREEKSCLHKLKLSIRKYENDESCLTRWIDFVATRELKHLDVECFLLKRVGLEVIPLRNLHICESLIYLRLYQVSLSSFEFVSSLPCAKTMCLEHNIYANEVSLESLISSCHGLEDLSIVRRVDDNVMVLRVRSQTLISLSVGFGACNRGFDSGTSGILIDAPKLKYLNFSYEVSKSKTINNLGSLVEVNFSGFFTIQDPSEGVGLSKNQMACNFLRGISRVKDMFISNMTMEFFSSYMKE